MPAPGPWVQPDDVTRVAVGFVGFGGGDNHRPWTTSPVDAGSGSFAGLLTETSFVITEEDPTVARVATSYASGPPTWGATVTMIRFDPQFVSLAPVPPTSAELAAPHVVGYEYEGGSGALGTFASDDLTIETWLALGDYSFTATFDPSNVIEYRVYEMTEGVDYSLTPMTVSGWNVNQVHALAYPNQARLAGRTIMATNHAGTEATNNYPQAIGDGASFVGSVSAPSTYAVVIYNLYSGVDFSVPSTLVLLSPSFQVSALVRPPRYRLLYDHVPPLRQFPRDDGLTGTSVARQRPSNPTSVQASPRQRPAAYL